MDTLANEYGWAKDDILDKTYLEEVLYLQKQILKRRLNDWKMEVRIAHGDPEKTLRDFDRALEDPDEIQGVDYAAFDLMVTRMQHGTAFQVKKPVQ